MDPLPSSQSHFKRQIAEGQVQTIVHCQLRTYHLSIFTLVFQRELNNFTLVGSSGENIVYFNLQVEEILYC